MAFLPGLVKIVKKVAKPLGHIIEGIPGIGPAFKAAEGVGGAVEKALKLVKKVPLPVEIAGGAAVVGGGVAIIASGGGGGPPALPGSAGGAIVPGASYGPIAVRGRGAMINPQIAAAVMAYALPSTYLRTYYKAPRGYVIIRNAQGQPAAIPKMLAIKAGLWHHPHKAPISAGDWHKYQIARRVEKKLRMLAVHALRHYGRRRETAAQERTERRHHIKT